MENKRYKHISQEQRYQISALLKAGLKISFIAEQLNLHRSTLYRELKRNTRPRGSYDANYANQYAEIRKERFAKTRKLTHKMISFIKDKLENEQWSPEQIKGYCKKENIPMVSLTKGYINLSMKIWLKEESYINI
jgi:IS30 family transposase